MVTTISNKWLQKSVEEMRQHIFEGGSLYEAFKSTKAFPLMVVEMIGIGETGGKLQQVLENVSSYLEEEADEAMNKFLTYLEPALIIMVGGIVLFVLLGIYMPIFSLQNILRTL
jgi:type II secretory pathway component PulF